MTTTSTIWDGDTLLGGDRFVKGMARFAVRTSIGYHRGMTDGDGILLQVGGLTKHYGEVRAVDGITFSVPRRTVFTILGPNGAGKTTTLEILEGLRAPDSGEIELFGRRIARVDRREKARMGVLLQEGNFEPYLRVKEVVRLFAAFFPKARPVEEVLELVALTEKKNALVKELSGGQRQRLALGTALVNDPDLLFLDEPTTGLDPQARRNIWSIVTDLKAQGKTIVLTTHYMEEAEVLSDHVCIMDYGKIIAAGSPRELTARLGEETIIEFTAPDLSTLPPAEKVRQDGDVVVVEISELVPALRDLLAWAHENGVSLDNMVIRQPNLEDVFLTLTGRRLRE